MSDYDEADELRQYMLRNWTELMTPLEREAERLGMLREKARFCDTSSVVSREFRKLYEAEVRAETLQLIGQNLDDVRRFQERVAKRINAELAGGELKPNRCPACDRIVKTPQARQCLWCGHDCHGG